LDQQDVLPESEKFQQIKSEDWEYLAKYKLQLSEIGIADYTATAERE
jgi:hypothetical protein